MAESEECDTKLCGNCKRHIRTSNFVMHEVHCHRNIALCKHCNEPIPKGEMEVHYEETHAEIPCPKCAQKVEKSLLEKHEEELCPKRPVKCTFCEMDVAHSELEAHHGYCGTRTEACPKCGQFIMVKDLVKHEDSNCTYPTPKPTNQNPVSLNLTNGNSTGASSFVEPDELLFGGGEMNMFAFEEMKRILNATEGPGASGMTVSDGMRQGKKPVGSVMRGRGQVTDTSISTGRTSKDKNKANQKSDLNRKRERASVTSTSTSNSEEQDRLLAMHLAHDLGESDDIEDLIRNLDKPQNFDIPDDYPHHMVDPDSDSGDMTMLPCEFCGDIVPRSQLVMHQSHCTEDPFSSLMPHAASTVNNSTSPHIDDNRYSRLSQGSRPSAAPHMIDNLRNVAPAEWTSEDWEASASDNIVLPCEFCDYLFPQDMLVQHQAVCDQNTTMTPRVMSPATTSSSASRRPPRPGVPSDRSKRHQPSVDIGAILSSNSNSKEGASNAARGTHSYKLDSTLRKYGSGSFDPYTDRRNRRMVREGTFDKDDEPEDHSPRQSVVKRSNPRTKSAAKTRETLDRLLHDDNFHLSSPTNDFLEHLPSSGANRRLSSDRSKSKPTGMPSSPLKSSSLSRGGVPNIHTSTNARSVQRELQSGEQDNTLFSPVSGTVSSKKSSSNIRPTGKPTSRPPSNRSSGSLQGQNQGRNGLGSSGAQQRNRTGNQIFDFRSDQSGSRNSRNTRGYP